MLRSKKVFVIRFVYAIILIFLAGSCSASVNSAGSEFEIIKLKEYYNGMGAIIPGSYKNIATKVFCGEYDSSRIDLTVQQIELAEKILEENLESYVMDIDDTDYFPQDVKTREDTLSSLKESVKVCRTQLKKYYRQYLGYLNDNDEMIVSIFLFDYKSASSTFSNWRHQIIFGFDGDFYDYTNHYYINLTKGIID